LLLPLVDAELDASFAPESHDQGVGDLIVSPFLLQWNDRKLFGKPFFQRLDLQMVFPTGKYNASRALNIGNNVVSVNPDYAFTIFPSRKLEVSARLHYLWNSENDSPYRRSSRKQHPAGSGVPRQCGSFLRGVETAAARNQRICPATIH
jgi:hypothetical protein